LSQNARKRGASEKELALRNWWICLAAAAVVIVGCTGSGGGTASTGGTGGTGGSTGGTTGGTTGGREVPTIVLPNTAAEARVIFLSGQGRRAAGSLYATLNNIRWIASGLDIAPSEFQGSTDGTRVQLDGYTVNRFGFVENLGEGVASKAYTSLAIDVTRMYEEDVFGDLNNIFAGNFPMPAIPVNATLRPGRQTTIQVFLSNVALGFDSVLGPVFDQAGFDSENLGPGDTALRGFYSDHIGFDISNVPSRPTMARGGAADVALFSGDAIGLAQGALGTEDSFDLYSPNFIESGTATGPRNIDGRVAPGTYTVSEPDPRTLPGVARIAALQGTWRDVNEVVRNLGSTALILFPRSTGADFQAVLIQRSGNTITNLWFGTSNGTTFTVSPISEVGSPTTTFTGNLSAVTARDGNFTLTGSGVPTSGVYVIYR
jgi:hypothetical protein